MAQELDATSNPSHTAVSSTSHDPCIYESGPVDAPLQPADTASNQLKRALPPESKFQQSKAPVPLGRHTAPTTAHINALPSEILAHIFQLVLGPNAPELESRVTLLPQDILSHVCTYWRQVATSSRKFWTLIDFKLLEMRFDRHLARAKTYASRASPAPLHVRISLGLSALGEEASASPGLAEFVATIAPRIESFFFFANGDLMALCRLLLGNCLAAATPGILRTLMIRVYEVPENGVYHSFIESVESPNTSRSLLLDVDQERLEAVLLPVRVLWLQRLYPYWTSKAYHGLTELRIESSLFKISIAESQLLGILVASPGLRTIRFAAEVTKSHSQPGSVVPAPLADLESLDLSLPSSDERQDPTLERALRMVAPGPKPFSLAIGGGNLDTHMLNGSVREFLSRTNVRKMYLAGSGTYSTVSEVLRLTPHLQELGLYGPDITTNYAPTEPHVNTRRVSSPGLVSLSLEYCGFELNKLRQVVESIKTRSLSVLHCRPVDDTQDLISEEAIRAALSDLCPVTRSAGTGGLRGADLEWEQHPELTGYV